jgi:hypothetical protein
METCNLHPRSVDPTVSDFRKDLPCPDLLSSYLSSRPHFDSHAEYVQSLPPFRIEQQQSWPISYDKLPSTDTEMALAHVFQRH